MSQKRSKQMLEHMHRFMEPRCKKGSLQMTKDWKDRVRENLKSTNWAKRKGTTGKTELSQQSLLEENLTFQK